MSVLIETACYHWQPRGLRSLSLLWACCHFFEKCSTEADPWRALFRKQLVLDRYPGIPSSLMHEKSWHKSLCGRKKETNRKKQFIITTSVDYPEKPTHHFWKKAMFSFSHLLMFSFARWAAQARCLFVPVRSIEGRHRYNSHQNNSDGWKALQANCVWTVSSDTLPYALFGNLTRTPHIVQIIIHVAGHFEVKSLFPFEIRCGSKRKSCLNWINQAKYSTLWFSITTAVFSRRLFVLYHYPN